MLEDSGTKGRFIIYRMGGVGRPTFADYGLMALEISFEASLVYPLLFFAIF